METHKQAATEGDCSKNLAEDLKGGNAAFGEGWVINFRQSLTGKY